MKLLILSIALVLLTSSLSQTTSNCIKAGCSCVDHSVKDGNEDSCANNLQRMCYKDQQAECILQSSNNQCGWTQSDWLTNCLSNAQSLSSMLTVNSGTEKSDEVKSPKAEAAKSKKDAKSKNLNQNP
jgi:hypothetical protein